MRHGNPNRALAPDRIAILAMLVALHALVLSLQWNPTSLARAPAPAMQWVIVPVQIEVPDQVETEAPPTPPRDRSPQPAVVREPQPAFGPAAADVGTPNQERSPPIDWAAEAARAAQDHAARIDEQSRNPAFGAPRAPGTIEIVPRQLQGSDFPWSSTGNGEGNVAVVRPPGEVPYLLLWNRCRLSVQLLAIFGCGIGPLPPARSDLFEGMDDPNRSRSSVPE